MKKRMTELRVISNAVCAKKEKYECFALIIAAKFQSNNKTLLEQLQCSMLVVPLACCAQSNHPYFRYAAILYTMP